MCDCKICDRWHRVEKLLGKIPSELVDEAESLFEEYDDTLESVETDYEVLLSKIAGVWPREDGEKYYERIDDTLYEVIGIPVEEKSKVCDHVFESDGGKCIRCHKRVIDMM